MEQQKIINGLELQLMNVKFQRDTLRKQVNTLKPALATSERLNEDLRKKNADLMVSNDNLRIQNKNHSRVFAVMAIAIAIETVILYLAVR